MKENLTRSASNKMIGGVCAGVARSFGLDTSVVRIVWLVLAVFAQIPWVIYLVMWLVLPLEEGGPSGFDELKRAFSGPSNPPSDLR